MKIAKVRLNRLSPTVNQTRPVSHTPTLPISRLTSPTSRLYQRLTIRPPQTVFYLVFNYLVPSLRGALKIGLKFICAQVLPRLLATAAALVDPSRSRSQQREVIVIIVPIVIQPTLDTSVNQQALTTASNDSQESPVQSLPRVLPNGFTYPTYATPFAVTVGLLLARTQ